jgi:hypothetical protein
LFYKNQKGEGGSMALRDMSEMEIVAHFLTWGKKSPLTQQAEGFYRKAFRIKPGQIEDMMACAAEQAQESTKPIIAKAFAVALKEGKLSTSIGALGSDEAMRVYANQLAKVIGLPPIETLSPAEQEKLLASAKSQAIAMTAGINITVGNIAQEIDRAIEIARQLNLRFDDMLSRTETAKLYLSQRFTKEEFLKQSTDQMETFIRTMVNTVAQQLTTMPSVPDIPPSDPRYRPTMRRIEIGKKAVLWQTDRRAKKIRRVFKRLVHKQAKEIFSKRVRLII